MLVKLLCDLVDADDSLVNNGFYVRETVNKDSKLIENLCRDIEAADDDLTDESNLRVYILQIFYRCNQRRQSPFIMFTIETHSERVEKEYHEIAHNEKNPRYKALYYELKSCQKVMNAQKYSNEV